MRTAMSKTNDPPDPFARNRRLEELLQQLANQGITQQQVARRLNVPASYLSDVKLARKTLSDSFARCFCTEFGVGLDWLLDGTGPQAKPQLAATASSEGPILVPIFSQPIAGDPQGVRAWDGSRVELSGAAAIQATRATQPYVLRCPVEDKLGRVNRNDLILVDQNISEPTSMVIIRDKDELQLARQLKQGFRSVETGRAISGKPVMIGVCLGIVWASL